VFFAKSAERKERKRDEWYTENERVGKWLKRGGRLKRASAFARASADWATFAKATADGVGNRSAFAEATADCVGWRLDRHYSLPPVTDYSSFDKVLTSIY